MKNKLKDPEYYFKVRTVWPNILYGKPMRQNKAKFALNKLEDEKNNKG